MNVLGENFYDMETHEMVSFGIADVLAVVVQPVYDEDVGKVSYCVIAFMKDARFVSTKPLADEKLAVNIQESMFVMDERNRF